MLPISGSLLCCATDLTEWYSDQTDRFKFRARTCRGISTSMESNVHCRRWNAVVSLPANVLVPDGDVVQDAESVLLVVVVARYVDVRQREPNAEYIDERHRQRGVALPSEGGELHAVQHLVVHHHVGRGCDVRLHVIDGRLGHVAVGRGRCRGRERESGRALERVSANTRAVFVAPIVGSHQLRRARVRGRGVCTRRNVRVCAVFGVRIHCGSVADDERHRALVLRRRPILLHCALDGAYISTQRAAAEGEPRRHAVGVPFPAVAPRPPPSSPRCSTSDVQLQRIVRLHLPRERQLRRHKREFARAVRTHVLPADRQRIHVHRRNVQPSEPDVFAREWVAEHRARVSERRCVPDGHHEPS